MFVYTNNNVTVDFNTYGTLFMNLGVWYCATDMKMKRKQPLPSNI